MFFYWMMTGGLPKGLWPHFALAFPIGRIIFGESGMLNFISMTEIISFRGLLHNWGWHFIILFSLNSKEEKIQQLFLIEWPLMHEYYTRCNSKSVRPYSCIMPMNRNVQYNRVGEDWTVTFLQSVLLFTSGLNSKIKSNSGY